MKVCYFGTYREEYSRNRIMISGLRRNGVTVIECHAPLWTGVENRVQTVSGGWRKFSFIWRVIRVYASLIKRYLTIEQHDLVIVGYPGQLDVCLARVLTWLRRKRLVWDIFMSIYLISFERGLVEKNRLAGSLLRKLEWIGVRLPDRCILDTEAYVRWFCDNYHATTECFRLVPTGADDSIFYPKPTEKSPDSPFLALYFGTFIPNHHVQTILEAAKILQDNPTITFELIGQGPDLDRCQELAEKYHLSNVRFIAWLEETDLSDRIAVSDVVLGAFGQTPQSLMTIQNKIYTGMAMQKTVITGESDVIRRSFKDGKQILLCRRKDPEDLAKAVLSLAQNPSLNQDISSAGYEAFKEFYTIERIGQAFSSHLEELVA